jgi:hypothetical protein
MPRNYKSLFISYSNFNRASIFGVIVTIKTLLTVSFSILGLFQSPNNYVDEQLTSIHVAIKKRKYFLTLGFM